MYVPKTQEEADYLNSYDPNRYEKPSVTADVVIFTLNEENELALLLIKRGGFPYKDCFAIPGGFVNMDETVEEGAKRELEEETGMKGVPVFAFGTYSDPDRDPRMRVITVAHLAFIPRERLRFAAGDDAADAKVFRIRMTEEGLSFENGEYRFTEAELAFDHGKVLRDALCALRRRVERTTDALEFFGSQICTVFELKKNFEAILRALNE